MMNTINKIMILSVLGWISNANAGLSSGEVILNNYYRDQANKQIEQILPKGKFSVQVNLKVNTSKMKYDNEIQPVKLPLGGTFVSGMELKASRVIDQSIDSMIKYVEQVNIIVSIAPGISSQAQELITNSLQSMVELDTKRGDQITFMDLPESVITAWTPEPSIEIYKKPAMLLSAFFGFLLIFGSIMITFVLKHIGSQIAKEARFLNGTIKDTIENSSGSINKSTMPMPTASVNTSSINQGGPSGFESPSIQFWEKVDADTITAFCYDCISQPIYSSIPGLLVGSFLDAAKAAEVENNLPLNILQNYNSKTSLKSSEVIQIFQKNQSEYRRAVRSPMSQQVLRVDVSTLIEFAANLKNVEVALLINSLTPLKRSSLLKMLSTDSKMDLAKASQENLSIVEHKKFEISLIEKIMKITQNNNNKEEFHSLNYLTSIILRTESFSEDEALYEKMGNQGEYRGVLLAFDYFQNSDWEEISPQDLAIAFAGYSDKYKSAIIEKFSGKKLEWVKNFFSKYEKVQPEFHSSQVEALQEFIIAKIKNIQAATGDESEQKQAA